MMGNKVNPIAFRLGNSNYNPQNRWFTTDRGVMQENIIDDYLIRRHILDYYNKVPTIYSININRKSYVTEVVIKSIKPNTLIGLKGKLINELSQQLNRISISSNVKLLVEFIEYALNSLMIARSLALELQEKRNFKLLIKKIILNLKYQKVLGYKIEFRGRINNASKTKTMKFKDGKIPLQSIGYDVDYAFLPVTTTYGIISIKVFICKGILTKDNIKDNIKASLFPSVNNKSNVKPFFKKGLAKPEYKKTDTKRTFSSNNRRTPFNSKVKQTGN